MNLKTLLALLPTLAFALPGLNGTLCGAAAGATATVASTPPQTPQRVREAAVAGLFYPKEKAELARNIDRLLAAAPAHSVADLRALICPHAGYPYSGPTAACGFKTLQGRDIKTVVVMAPSHYAAFRGIAVGMAQAYRTPLGLIPVSDKAIALATRSPFAAEPACRVERPTWWKQSSLTAPPALNEDRPETWEHSLEVELPFLQKTLTGFKLVPAVFGDVSPEDAARQLLPLLDDQTLLVASSDLSHYLPYDTARGLDERTVKAICGLDTAALNQEDACGRTPILTLLHIAKQKGWKARRLDYRNSGDTAGDKRAVVGYTAIAFFAPGQEKFSSAEWKRLLQLARDTVKAAADGKAPPAVDEANSPASFKAITGCFVTLTRRGELRGCIGHIIPQRPLAKAVIENAVNAALHDFRFPPLESKEVGDIEIEVSVLTEPKPLEFTTPEDLLRKLHPHKDGVVLRLDGNAATYLPQVWAEIPDKVEFLDSLSRKAGSAQGAWRKPGTRVLTYQVQAARESEL